MKPPFAIDVTADTFAAGVDAEHHREGAGARSIDDRESTSGGSERS
jgi:hypothetical protein